MLNKNSSFFLPGVDLPKDDFESSGDFAITSLKFIDESEYIFALSNSFSTKGMLSHLCQKDDGHGAGGVVALSFSLFRGWGSKNRDIFGEKRS